LAAQQQAVQKGHPVTNEYWVTNSSVQSVTPNQATMLLFMQGQRGTPPDDRYISATVRVTFAKGADTHWRVDDLTVLTKPNPGQAGK
jgi:Mce-associated membrane protein